MVRTENVGFLRENRRIIVRYIKIIEFKEAYIYRLIVIIAILKEGKLGIKQEY
jgi:hypothetical protein